MRWVHCGKPIKREYVHYACEFYDSDTIRDRIYQPERQVKSTLMN